MYSAEVPKSRWPEVLSFQWTNSCAVDNSIDSYRSSSSVACSASVELLLCGMYFAVVRKEPEALPSQLFKIDGRVRVRRRTHITRDLDCQQELLKTDGICVIVCGAYC